MGRWMGDRGPGREEQQHRQRRSNWESHGDGVLGKGKMGRWEAETNGRHRDGQERGSVEMEDVGGGGGGSEKEHKMLMGSVGGTKLEGSDCSGAGLSPRVRLDLSEGNSKDGVGMLE